MEKRKKKTWETPRLVVYGDIEKLTASSTYQNADSPTGTNNAYCNYGTCPS